ncbi:enoyl-CoA hydratase/isomerase family protein [Euzebya tangerina]|uniref:enoyl-CoA hydratase/isomerase family protein n=1 Tax=Euzebya tangerina TaxID=591198 RepID=UPI002F3575A3
MPSSERSDAASVEALEPFTAEVRDDGVAILTIDRPDKQNAMSVAFFENLEPQLDIFDADDRVRVVIITGAGEEAFSAGGDIESFLIMDDVASYRRRLKLVFDAFHAVERCEVPVIAAVNGVAYGGGTELSLAADLVIASDRAKFAFREPVMGLMPGYGVVRGPAVIGPQWTRYLALSANPIDGATAERIGLALRCVPHEQLMDTAIEVAAGIARRAPLSVRMGKAFINRTQGAPGLAESIEATALLFTTQDHKNAAQAFLDKERPTFEGR